jgi:hypothetical protein
LQRMHCLWKGMYGQEVKKRGGTDPLQHDSWSRRLWQGAEALIWPRMSECAGIKENIQWF